MADYAAVLDACVLYPFALRDTLIRLSIACLYRAKWTSQIDDEWLENLVKNGMDRAKLIRTRELMHKAVPDWEITGHDKLISSLTLPDPNDRHVLAAAISGKTDAIITTNLKHFPVSILDRYDIEPLHPDDFAVSQINLGEQAVIASFKRQRASLKHPPMSADEFLLSLDRCELTQTAARLRSWKELI